MESSQRYRRRIKLIQPRLQLKLVGAFAGLCMLAIAVQTLVLGASMAKTARALPSGGIELANELPDALTRSMLTAFLMVLPALVILMVHMTFRIAGPLYRFEQHLKAIRNGEWPGKCAIRKRDELQDFCTLLNEALESAREIGAREATSESSVEESQAA